MNKTLQSIICLGIVLTVCSTRHAAAAENGRFQIEIDGVSARSTPGWIWGDSAESPGVSLGLKYRASRRFGLALDVMTAKVESDTGFEFFDTNILLLESSVRMTPVLARLDIHLTPDDKVAFVVGPVLGYIQYGDLKTEIRSDFLEGSVPVERLRTKDGFAWGAHMGLDVPFGKNGLYFTAGVTLLKAEVETEDDADSELGQVELDLDPFIVQTGFGYRF